MQEGKLHPEDARRLEESATDPPDFIVTLMQTIVGLVLLGVAFVALWHYVSLGAAIVVLATIATVVVLAFCIFIAKALSTTARNSAPPGKIR